MNNVPVWCLCLEYCRPKEPLACQAILGELQKPKAHAKGFLSLIVSLDGKGNMMGFSNSLARQRYIKRKHFTNVL
jgi:hypothetical protein